MTEVLIELRCAACGATKSSTHELRVLDVLITEEDEHYRIERREGRAFNAAHWKCAVTKSEIVGLAGSQRPQVKP